jgi:alginate O-acetyltransferase complex protein AlgI
LLFNSFEFLIFLPIVFFLYWIVFKHKLKSQNLIIVLSSYLFYSFWDYRFLSLIFLSTLVDYYVGLNIPKQTNLFKQRALLLFSVCCNLGILGFFKYYNFFIDSWVSLFSSMGYEITSYSTLNIVLPVGISFYTFQTMSYTIDVYKNKLKPVEDFISFASFVAFFPQLVAGPIERATNLLPQMLKKRKFSYQEGRIGVKLIIWGMFKKVVIADSLAPIVDSIFSDYQSIGGGELWLGAIYFSFQIYCDFSGYSDMAIGISKLFGFNLKSNFKFPYFSRNIGEFWRRWHISLSSWFRDYLYIPLGGSRYGMLKSIRNVFLIFLISGLWHGASITFLAWGAFHAILFIPSFILNTNRKYSSEIVAFDNKLPSFQEFFQVVTTFSFVTLGWVFFRSETISDAMIYLYKMIFEFNIPSSYRSLLPLVMFFCLLDWIMRKDERDVLKFGKFSLAAEIILILIIINLFGGNEQFIYFQF